MRRAQRIDSTSEILNVAFQDPEGSLVLIASHDTGAPQAFRVVWQGKSFAYSLPVNTSATFSVQTA